MKDLAVSNLHSTNANKACNSGLIIGNRITEDYFITSGTGESNITVHAGFYHLAHKDSEIESANIITYSSIFPAISSKMDIIKKSFIPQKEYGTALVALCFINNIYPVLNTLQ